MLTQYERQAIAKVADSTCYSFNCVRMWYVHKDSLSIPPVYAEIGKLVALEAVNCEAAGRETLNGNASCLTLSLSA